MGNYLVTGASGGMGAALCHLLLREGHRVWGLDRTPPGEEGAWTFVPADVTDSASLEAAFARVQREAGKLAGIVHTAGIYDLNSLAEMPEEDFLRDFDVNVFGVFRVNRLFLPLLAEKGRIVIVTSELAPLEPLPFTGIYAVTKTALDKYAAALRMELQLTDRSVIVIRPGAVNTGMLPVSRSKLERFCEETKLYSVNAVRFRRIVDRVEARSVSPERVAGLILRALTVPRPRLVCCLNRNPLLLLFQALPLRLRLLVIRRILS